MLIKVSFIYTGASKKFSGSFCTDIPGEQSIRSYFSNE